MTQMYRFFVMTGMLVLPAVLALSQDVPGAAATAAPRPADAACSGSRRSAESVDPGIAYASRAG